MLGRTSILSNRISSFSTLRYYCSRGADNSTINSSEIAKFSAQAAKWWHPQGSAAPLHRLNPDESRSLKPLTGVNVIDVGCGGGVASEPIARLGANVLGVDMAKESIQVAQSHAQLDPYLASGTNLQYRQAAVENIVKEGKKFDAVLALEIVEHVSDPKLFITECSSLVQPGGVLIMSTLNRTPLSYALGIFVAERVVKWLPPGTHDWTKFLRPDEIADVIKNNTDLVPNEVIGLGYNPLKGFSIVKDTNINYMLTAIKPIEKE